MRLFVLFAIATPVSAQNVDYVREVRPLLAARCYTCHGALKQKGGLRIDTVAAMKEGGDHGAIVVAGKSNDSLLVKHLLGNGVKRMPPEADGEALKPDQIALVKRWVEQGANGPKDEKPESDPRDHWAFRGPMRPPTPKVKDAKWMANAIDAFIAAEHEKRGLKPQGDVEPGIWLRRVYLDLIGLPPTREEQTEFLRDCEKPQAYEKVVDRLLASPQYGERWGRHWMDIWRYSDWWGLGAELRNSQRHIWHWRDWIVESLNKDKGYAQMLQEMLAADELYPTDDNALRGTGFLARHYFLFNRTTWLDETIEHTSKAFLGLTLNCCKCHDHKYDAFSQVDYYRFRAIFEPYQIRTDLVSGETDVAKNGVPRVYDANLNVQTFLHIRGNEASPDKNRKIAPGLPSLLLPDGLQIEPIKLPAEAHHRGLQAFVLEDQLRAAQKQFENAQKEFLDARRREGSDGNEPQKYPVVMTRAEEFKEATIRALKARAAADHAVVHDPSSPKTLLLKRRAAEAEAAQAFILAQYNLARIEAGKNTAKLTKDQAKAAVDAARKAMETAKDVYAPLVGSVKTRENNLETDASRLKPFPKESTGRRAAFAKWVADRQNPLTARVAVNHIWTRHFGQPLVATVFDFGRKGAAPTHPELLNWLAVELMENKWSMKHVHRLLVLSQTYRMTSSTLAAADKNLKDDADNRWYWRMNSQRMESQVVRDSLLHLAGELDLTQGGPSIEGAQQETSKRRSLYFFHSAIERNRFLTTFDEADPLDCYRRRDSIIPQQALALSNSKLAANAAEKIALRLEKIVAGDAFAHTAFEWILGYAPNANELAACDQAMARWIELNKTRPDREHRARAQLVQALLNHNDFVTVR